MPAIPPITTALPLGQKFKLAIEKAQLEGISPSALLLQLTLADASKLKRDQTVPTEDISFADGKMRYLGVQVAEGAVTASALVAWPTADPPADDIGDRPAAVTRKRRAASSAMSQ